MNATKASALTDNIQGNWLRDYSQVCNNHFGSKSMHHRYLF